MSTTNNNDNNVNNNDSSINSTGKDRFRRYAALTGVILIVVMVIATLISAVVDSTGRVFRSCLIVTIALPIALWVFIWAYGAMTHRHTIASFDLGATGPGASAPESGDAASSETGAEASDEDASAGVDPADE